MTGEESASSFLISGGFVSRGSSADHRRHRVANILRGNVDIAIQVEGDGDDGQRLSVEVERILSMPSTVATASSMRRVTVLSISSGRRAEQDACGR